MAKVIWEGWAKPDDPIYKTGPVIGGKRFSYFPKDGEPAPENTPKKKLSTVKPQS
jgi:hypothetical protein